MRIMVLGATGFIGPAVVARLTAMGHEAVAVSRGGGPEAAGVQPVSADRNDAPAVAGLAAERRVEGVIDLLGFTIGNTAPLLAALSGRVGRYVLASSGDVYAQYDGLHRKGAAPPLPILDEAAPLRARLHPYRAAPRRPAADPQAWMDDYDKIPIERAALAAEGLEACVVRLPMVFGPRDRQRRFAWAIGPMLAGEAAIEIDTGWAAWRTSYGFVEDVAQGLALAAAHPRAAGRIYNLGPLEAPDHLAWAGRLAHAIGWRGALRQAPRERVGRALRTALDGLDLSYPMVTDTRRIRAELDYAEVVEADEALARTIADEAARMA